MRTHGNRASLGRLIALGSPLFNSTLCSSCEIAELSKLTSFSSPSEVAVDVAKDISHRRNNGYIKIPTTGNCIDYSIQMAEINDCVW